MRPTPLLAVISLLSLTGCARWAAGGPDTLAPSETAVLAELGVVESRPYRTAKARPGPSLVAGDGLAMHWALAHGVIAADDAGSWRPAMLVAE